MSLIVQYSQKNLQLFQIKNHLIELLFKMLIFLQLCLSLVILILNHLFLILFTILQFINHFIYL